MDLTHIIQIILALGLLLLGRKLYWVFVGAIGFISVTEWAFAHFQGLPEITVLLIGLAVGLLGALLAVFLRAAGIGLAGFLGGAYLFMTLAALFNITSQPLELGLTFLGGVLGLIFVLAVFDWALILISSLSGAIILAGLVPLAGVNDLVWIVLFALVGVIIQARMLARE